MIYKTSNTKGCVRSVATVAQTSQPHGRWIYNNTYVGVELTVSQPRRNTIPRGSFLEEEFISQMLLMDIIMDIECSCGSQKFGVSWEIPARILLWPFLSFPLAVFFSKKYVWKIAIPTLSPIFSMKHSGEEAQKAFPNIENHPNKNHGNSFSSQLIPLCDWTRCPVVIGCKRDVDVTWIGW